MVFKIKTQETQLVPTLELVARKTSELDAAQKAEIRRQMYERIARGSALAEVEADAHRKWDGQ